MSPTHADRKLPPENPSCPPIPLLLEGEFRGRTNGSLSDEDTPLRRISPLGEHTKNPIDSTSPAEPKDDVAAVHTFDNWLAEVPVDFFAGEAVDDEEVEAEAEGGADGEREDATPREMPLTLPIESIRICHATCPAPNGIAC